MIIDSKIIFINHYIHHSFHGFITVDIVGLVPTENPVMITLHDHFAKNPVATVYLPAGIRSHTFYNLNPDLLYDVWVHDRVMIRESRAQSRVKPGLTTP